MMRKRYEDKDLNPNTFPQYDEYRTLKYKSNIHSLSFFYAYAFCAFLLSVFIIVYLIDSKLPTPLMINDEETYPEAFITERAHHDLKLLTELGPRVTGSYENEILSIDLLKREITFITNMKHPMQQIELDVQTVTGSYYLNYTPNGVINSYSMIQNVIVKLYAINETSNSILINAHFDSVPTSPGGSDDGINCAVMLEVLRKLSRLRTRPTHNIIFLFNGAEETPLQASHGFITRHRWAKETRIVINLDAAGAGGKEVLFQTGPNAPWLLKYYSQVPYPNGQAAGEEIFQSNIIPSDTDFRIFRDFGQLIGYDLAFVKNGYRYHTKFDNFTNIPLGSFQHVGANVLSLVKSLANAEEIHNVQREEKGKAVYFDYLGFFLISYSQTTAFIINLVCALVSVIVAVKALYDFNLGVSKDSLIYLLLSIGGIVLGWLLSGICTVLTALFLDWTNLTMSWYSHPFFTFGIYVTPIILCNCFAILLMDRFNQKNNICISVQTQMQLHAVRFIWSVLLVAGTLYGLRTSYALLILVTFATIGMIVIQLFKLQHSIIMWRFIYIVPTLIPLVFLQQQTITTLSLFIPITGRIGPDRNPEFYIGSIVYIFTIVSISIYVPFVKIIRKPKMFLYGLFALYAISLIAIATPIGFPYSGDLDSPAPERFWTFHTSRTFRNSSNSIIKKDSGIFMLNLDRNSPNSVRKYVKDLERVRPLKDDCELAIFCGLPISNPRMIPIVEDSTWIPSTQPIIHEPIGLKATKTFINNTIIRLQLTATGPDRLTIYIQPKNQTKLIATSLTTHLPRNVARWKDLPVYFIHHTSGKENLPFEFYLDFAVAENWNESITNVGLSGVYVHTRQHVRTPQYQQFLTDFPKWADVVAYLGMFENWTF